MRHRSSSFLLAALLAAPALGATTLSSMGCDGGGGTGGNAGAGATAGDGGTGGNATGGNGGSTTTADTGGTGGNGGNGAGGNATGGTGGTGGSADSQCFDYSTFDGTTPTVSFKADVLPIFQQSCGVSTSCHGNINVPDQKRPYLGPNKNTVATEDDITAILTGIVDQPSFFEPAMGIVTSGDPSKSFLLYKIDYLLECSALQCTTLDDCGDPMPKGARQPLPQNTRDTIRRWIAQGAKND